MKKIKVGFLPFYIKLYDDSHGTKLRAPMERYMETSVKMLESEGISVIMADEVCRIASEFEDAVEKFVREDVDAVVTMHLAYSPSLEAIEALKKLSVPIIVYDSTPDYQLIGAAGYENRTTPNHGIHGVQDMCSMLMRNEIPYYICAGHALHSEVISELAGLCRAAAVKKSFQNMRIGSVGGSFQGMGDFQITDERYKNEIGAEVIYMTHEDAAEYLGRVTEEEIIADIAEDKEKFNVKVHKEDEYRASAKAGLAMRKWMEEKGIGSLTANFLTMDESGLPKMPFVECCKTLGRGLGYAGEGDVLTAGLVGALHSVYPDTNFVEMFCPDWEKDVVLLSHMGESNPSLAKWKPIIMDRPFNYNSCGDTVAMFMCMRGGDATIVNLAPKKKGFKMILCPGKMLDEGIEQGAYMGENQGWFKPLRQVSDFLKEYSKKGGTHHSAMVYGVPIEEIEIFGEMMGFEVVVIK